MGRAREREESRRAGPGGRLERREGAAARARQARARLATETRDLGGKLLRRAPREAGGSTAPLDDSLKTPRESVPAPISRWSRATSVERNGRAESGAGSRLEAGLSVLHPGHLPVDRRHRHWPRSSHGTSRRPQRWGAYGEGFTEAWGTRLTPARAAAASWAAPWAALGRALGMGRWLQTWPPQRPRSARPARPGPPQRPRSAWGLRSAPGPPLFGRSDTQTSTPRPRLNTDPTSGETPARLAGPRAAPRRALPGSATAVAAARPHSLP